ncbi:fructosamine kinase family protein [Nitrosomonas sp. Nm166]|uniref:fructosamine kinase family protein n=1 Tax=Nitrosomonas sp. Nm166 TaxID=1881054 RepID=UPI0008ED327E|nr:fructosamine kinase family protein [Nitrosomonas sp. Nm166]SFE82483.1 Fructosamine-3-kinase [Nitrosomonas sp. Nm166]
MHAWHEISAQISAAINSHFKVKESQAIGGGCINQAYRITDGNRCYFVKLNTSDSLAMFEAEAAGLMEIHQSHTIRVPLPICYGQDEHTAWLVLEYLDIHRSMRGNASELGIQLASMHRITARQFGWVRNNTIGQTPQINTTSSDWVYFWKTHRLGYQLDLAQKNGFDGKLQKLGERLLIDLDKFFPGVTPLPSLLHGDLWNGNYAYREMGNPVLFDPAVYYGDREADIAMTELFGGFSVDFYSAYRNDYPLDSGYNLRKIVYNLYHILNHLNLFGSGYHHQAEQMMSLLLAEIH